MLTLIYARYSSTLQNPRSVEDQLAACRARADREGWTIAGEYHDRAISGAAGIEESQRPGLAALLARLEAGGIEQVLTESTDRIARHQGDAFAVRERIEHAGARLFTLMDGHVDDITGTIKGLFDSRFRKDLASRVRRGHKGTLAQGRHPSGVAYGYRRVTDVKDGKGDQVHGLREIDPGTSVVVVRLFEQYAGGHSPRQLAGELNADRIPGPRAGPWTASTIAKLLRNPIYIGRLEYGRTRSVTDPQSRRRKMVRAGEDLASAHVPHLRIVGDDLWQAVQADLAQRATGPAHRQRRPRHLLSGLGRCGVCGRGWIVTRGEYFGCAGVIESNACSNRRLITKSEYERRVLAELREQMLAPEVVAAYLDEYRAEHARAARSAAKERGQLERRQAEAARKVGNLVAAIGLAERPIPELLDALAAARAEAATVAQALASAEALPQIALHPGLARQYRAAIEHLSEELADEATRREAGAALRKLIARIELTPGEGRRGVEVTVIRHIDEVLALTRRAI